MLLADKKDYKRGYCKHKVAYEYMVKTKGNMYSRCLLLLYSVECGLKWILLDRWRIDNPKRILENKNDERREILASHNLEKILNQVNQSRFHFPQIRTNHKDNVTSEDAHQMYRYGINVDDRDQDKLGKYEEVLSDVAEWIGEEM